MAFQKRKKTIYEILFKRPLDIILCFIALVILSPLFLILGILVKIKLGGPVFFKQKRPGKNESVFTMYKFRTMTNETDDAGNLRPDAIRLTKFGNMLRAASLDELPGLLNILKGDMSIVGPRPQLIKDIWFMSEKQRQRHAVRPGLTGLAQVSGRNTIKWEERLSYDIKYIRKITFIGDLVIIFKTIFKVLRRKGISEEGICTSTDLGEYLLLTGQIQKAQYDAIIKENS